MKTSEPIYVTDLFPELDARLIELLRGLSDEDWNRPTVCALWDVKDIAAHLLDGNLRKLSTARDHYFGDRPEGIHSHQDLVSYLNRLNNDWVRAARRLSPHILISLLEQTGREVYQMLKSVNPHELAPYPVAWAGEAESKNWFDIAREYTERWHHQQQIRLATDNPAITERKLYHPALDTFMRALPHTYRDIPAPEGTLLKFIIDGEAGGDWFLLKQSGSWLLIREGEGPSVSEVTIRQEIAWRIFTKGISEDAARENVRIQGDQSLGLRVLGMVSVMA